MEYKITNTTFATLDLMLNRGESVDCEQGAYIYSTKPMDIKGGMKGGFLKSLTKSILTNESFFTQKLISEQNDTLVSLGAKSIGEIKDIEITPQSPLNVIDGAYLADIGDVEYTSTRQKGLSKGLFGNGGFFILKLYGSGTTFINSFGSIKELEISQGDNLIVDNQHVLAWSAGVDYHLQKSSKGIFNTLSSGEGLVASFTGVGKIYVQTHNLERQTNAQQPYIVFPASNGNTLG